MVTCRPASVAMSAERRSPQNALGVSVGDTAVNLHPRCSPQQLQYAMVHA